MSRDVADDFPILAGRRADGPFIYLDSAATSLKPRSVVDAQRRYDEVLTANVHRGTSFLAEEASYRYEAVRGAVAGHIGAGPAEIVFCPNSSYALEGVCAGLRLERDDLVLCAVGNHHSNLLPWLRRARVAYVAGNPLEPLDLDAVRDALRRLRPRVFAFGWVSNVNGAVNPARELCALARDHGAVSVVDAAQAVPHMAVDVRHLGCDFLTFSGHKMLGPAGTGILWGKGDLLDRLEPLALGGGSVEWVSLDAYALKEVPHRLEPGTPNIGGVFGLGAAVDYLRTLGPDFVSARTAELADRLDREFADIPGCRSAGPAGGGARAPILSLALLDDHLSPDLVCRMLGDSFGIVCRSGFLCARPALQQAGLTQGVLRFSAYVYNEVDEIAAAAAALRQVLGVIAR